jgi:hypothetical protein
MPNWMDERINQRALLKSHESAIALGIDPLWRNLCLAVESLLKQYQKAYPQEKYEWNGPLATEIAIRLGLRSPHNLEIMGKELNRADLKLDNENRRITFNYDKPCRGQKSGILQVGVNGDGQASFLDDAGNPITIDEAARIIIDPFLFPDLPSRA